MDEHTPVLVEAVVPSLALRPDGLYVDATFGRGGHTARILEALSGDGEIIAIDRDPQAIAAGSARFGFGSGKRGVGNAVESAGL